MATANHEVDEIRRQMAQIRRELHEDMQGVVAGAEAASDWKYYVQRYPWAALGLAAALGYFVVPRRRRSSAELAERAAEQAAEKVKDAVKTAKSAPRGVRVEVGPDRAEKKERKAGLIGMVFGMVTPVLLKVAQSYAVNFAENWLLQQQAAGLGPMSAGAPPGGPAPRPGMAPGGPRPGPAAGPRPGGPGPTPGGPTGGPTRPL